ncbi:hypothetical protein G7B40_036500 [Aetokthonos hydrillicola Thurmond2011]|jgi:hypothetical protein|uniref:Uncharacterized protein n=1 Tax=Aetokthonos hydrillicola Thurmond2011 TaxID=2712845 RepID=A0AAP5IEG5_9CYAN|nr:hypothetical protein [Aetokthonos hydrillicola]MBO3457958.1 hypothetical protein [Aetokthonos hydrillicola CCALA 1050]MBW4587448.1 hypothetical protein [Aetokthonos hydrillicola CCALA 1050]MDR9900016.1 hypothetical protein [Aetokthonos hydrillicola Thurmond2011]
MTLFPKDDNDLVNFLRQNRPEVPSASLDLEQQILDNIAMLHPISPPIQIRNRRPVLWLIPSMIAASLVAAIVGYRALMSTQETTSPAELAKLERFMENNWHGTVGQSPEGDVFSVSEMN